MLLFLEGPDGAGKSTLAEELRRAFPGASYTHHGPYKGLSGRELGATIMGSMRPAFRGTHTFIDRCWWSEHIYSRVCRGTESRLYPELVRMLERAALVCNGVIVRCLPPYENCREAFLSGREELLQDEGQLRQVYEAYAAGFETSLPVVTYDYTQHDLGDVIHRIRLAVDEYPVPEVTLLGDRPNVKTHAQQQYHVPFVTFSGIGCSEWLSAQLEASGVPEAKIDWYNAFADDGTPLDPALLSTDKIVALGRHAQQWCEERGIDHVHCPHPQVHKRFHSHKPYPLVNILKELCNA